MLDHPPVELLAHPVWFLDGIRGDRVPQAAVLGVAVRKQQRLAEPRSASANRSRADSADISSASATLHHDAPRIRSAMTATSSSARVSANIVAAPSVRNAPRP